MTLGLGGLVSGDFNSDGTNETDFYVINAKVAIALGRKTAVGLRNFQIWEATSGRETVKFNALGAYLQWDYVKMKGIRLSLEGGYYFSNYCNCGNPNYATKRANSNFMMIGGGVEFRLFSNFYLELSLRKGLYFPGIENVKSGDIGLIAHGGIIYHLRLR